MGTGTGEEQFVGLEGGRENHHHLPPTSSHQNSQPKRTAAASPKQRPPTEERVAMASLGCEASPPHRSALHSACLKTERGISAFRNRWKIYLDGLSGKNAAGKGIGRCRRASLSCRTIFVEIGGKESSAKESLFSSKESPNMPKL